MKMILSRIRSWDRRITDQVVRWFTTITQDLEDLRNMDTFDCPSCGVPVWIRSSKAPPDFWWLGFVNCPSCHKSFFPSSIATDHKEIHILPYDSTNDTLAHIWRVADLLHCASGDLIQRANVHDTSKLNEPEKSIFDAETPNLRSLTYGSPEYAEALARMKVALDHHYANNRHHPQHFENGIRGMNLLDLVEMLLDWKAASERHADGDILRSIEINQNRFDYSDELKQILTNTVEYMALT